MLQKDRQFLPEIIPVLVEEKPLTLLEHLRSFLF
jgi:hypothetical protein